MRLKVLAACCLCYVPTAWAAQPAWELAQPDAKVLLGVDVRGLRNSSLADSLPPETRSQMQAPLAMFHVPGIELLDDIDSVFLSSTGTPAAPAAGAPKPGTVGAAVGGAPKASAPFLLALSGTFPDEHLRPLLKGVHPSYRGINVYRGGGADSTSIAVLDEHTILLGDDKSIFRAIDRRTGAAQAEGPLVARARELAASNDVWIVAHDDSGNMQKASGPAAIFAAEIQGVELGLALRDGLNLDINLATKTEVGAQSLATLLTTQMQTAIGSKMDAAQAAEFWRRIKIGADGKRMQVQLSMTKEELRENIRLAQQQRAASPGAIASASSSAAGPGSIRMTTPSSTTPVAVSQPPAVSAPSGPPKPRTVKIYGLDDGVREIPLPPQH